MLFRRFFDHPAFFCAANKLKDERKKGSTGGGERNPNEIFFNNAKMIEQREKKRTYVFRARDAGKENGSK